MLLKRTFLFFSLLFFSFNIIYSSSFEIESDKNGVKIYADFSNEPNYSNNKYYNKYLSREFGYAIFSFNLVLPNGYEIKYSHQLTNDNITTNLSKIFETGSKNYSIDYRGIRRLNKIYTINIPLLTKNYKQKNKFELNIIYDNEIIEKDADSKELIFFKDIINPKHLNYLRDKQSSKENSEYLMGKYNWYDYTKKYIEFVTNEKSIYKVNTTEIIKFFPEYENKNIEYFHLINDGNDYPFYCSSKLLEKNQTIYFIGKKQTGDSTFYSHYSDFAKFYFYYDENTVSEKLEVNVPNPNRELSSVYIEKHFEEDKLYSWGNAFDADINDFEGWFWSELSSIFGDKTNKFSFLLPYTEVEGEDFNTLKIRYKTKYEQTHNHFIFNFFLNGLKESSVTEERYTDHEYELPYIYNTLDNYSLITTELIKYNTGNSADVNAFIDYIKYEGEVIPKALNGNIQLNTNEPSDFKIGIDNFTSESTVLINNENKIIVFNNEGEKGDYLRVNIDEDLSFIEFNDYSINTIANSILCIIGKDNSFNTYKFDKEADFIEFLNTTDEYDYLIISSNYKLKSETLDILSSFGITFDNSIYNFIYKNKIDDNNNINYSSNSKYFINKFFKTNLGLRYKNTVNFPKGKNENTLICDENTIKEINISEQSIYKNQNLFDETNQADVIILTHYEFKNSIDSLQSFHKKYKPHLSQKIVYVDEIYNQFNYGKKSPNAIKDFLKYSLDNWAEPKPQFLVIVGDASVDPKQILENSISIDYVPAYGFPTSDYWYSNLNDNSNNVDIMVGRIPINSDEELIGYISKMEKFSNMKISPWNKDFLFLIGGNKTEYGNIKKSTKKFSDLLTTNKFSNDTTFLNNLNNDPTSEKMGPVIRAEINKGKIWTNFLGHSSSEVFDMDGWRVEGLNNDGKYGFLTTISCNTGSFGLETDTKCRNETYIVHPTNGFVGNLGISTIGSYFDANLIEDMFEAFTDPSLNIRNIGEVVAYAKNKLSLNSYGLTLFNLYNYLGDPLLDLPFSKISDYYFDEEDVLLNNEVNKFTYAATDSVINIKVNILNNGPFNEDSLFLDVFDIFEGDTILTQKNLGIHEFNKLVEYEVAINNKPGKHKLILQLNPEKLIFEESFDNNILTINFDVSKNSMLSLDPFNYWNIDENIPHFRFISETNKDKESLNFELYDIDDNLIYNSKTEEISSNQLYIDWIPELKLINDSFYYLKYSINENSATIDSDKLFFNTYSDSTSNNVSFEFDVNAFKIKNKINVETENLEIHELNSEEYISIPTIYKDVYVKSDYRNRQIKITIDDEIFWGSRSDYRGYAALSYPSIIGKNTVRNAIFDTWGKDSATARNNANRFANFLTDSVDETDYIMITVADKVFRGPYHFNDSNDVGHITNLRKILTNYGAKLDTAFYTSFSWAFVGQRGDTVVPALEEYKFKDTASVSGVLPFYYENAKISLPLLGPSKKWKELIIDGKLNNTDVVLKVFDLNNDEIISFELNNNESKIDLSSIDELENTKYLRFELLFLKNNLKDNPIIKNIEINFEPLDELAINKLDEQYNDIEVMEADSLVYNITISNISLRNNVENGLINTSTPDNQINSLGIPYLLKNSEIINAIEFSTYGIIGENILKFEIQSDVNKNISDKGETYYFNNNRLVSLNVYSDTIPPTLVLMADNKEISNESFVSAYPNFELKMYDNSNIPITSINNIGLVRVNTYIDKGAATFTHNENFEAGYKASLFFNSKDTLQFGDYHTNSVLIYATDGSNNSTSMSIYVNRANSGNIANLINFPNPFNNQTSIRIDFIAPENNLNARIMIFDRSGKEVRTIKTTLDIGENIIQWDGNDNQNKSISNGIYYYMILLDEDLKFEPKVGKSIYLK